MNQATAPAPNLTFALNTELINLGTPNTLTLTLTNTSGSPLTLVGGVPVSEDAINGSSPSTAYFNLGSLINHAEFAALTVTSSDAVWQANYWGNSHPAVWGLCPSQNTTLASGDTVVFTLTLTPKQEEAGPGSFSIDYYNFPPNDGAGTANATLPVSLINAPTYTSGLEVGVEFLGSNVVRGTGALVLASGDTTAPIENTLKLQIVNTGSTAINPTGQWGSNAPQFLISFVCAESAPGYGAIAPANIVANDFVASVDDTANWTITPNTQTATPSWTLSPTGENKLILSPGGSVTVNFANVQTPFPVPLSTGYDVTNLRVQSVGIPNTNDTVITAPIYKARRPIIDYVICDPANPTSAQPNVTLTWATQNVSDVQFTLPYNSPAIDNPPPSGSASTTLLPGQSLTLTAFNVVDSSSLAGSIAVTYETATLSAFSPVSGTFDPSVSIDYQGALYLFGKDNNALTFNNSVPNCTTVSGGNNFTCCYAAKALTWVNGQELLYSVCSYGNSLYFCKNSLGAALEPVVLLTASFSGGTCGLATDDYGTVVNVLVTAEDETNTLYYVDPFLQYCSVSTPWSGLNFGPVTLLGYIPNSAVPFQGSLVTAGSLGIAGNSKYLAGIAVVNWATNVVVDQYVLPSQISLLHPFVVSSDGLSIYSVDADGPVVFTLDPNNNYAISLSRPFVRPIGDNPWVSLSADGRFLYILDTGALTVHDTKPVAVASGEPVYLSTHINTPIQGATGAIFPHPQDCSILYYLSSNSDIQDCSTWTTLQLEPWPFPYGASQ